MKHGTTVGIALAALPLAAAQPVLGQVSEIQIAPVTMTLTVGEQRTFLATAYDPTGNPVLTASFTWISTDLQVVTVTYDPASPQVATVTAVGPGVAQIEARSGGTVRSQAVIQVTAPQQAAPQLPDSVLPANVTTSTVSQVARIEPDIFGLNVSCRVGGFVASDLLLTTYRSIRGAQSLTVILSDGRRVENAQVAAYDVEDDLAILRVDGPGTGIQMGSDATNGQWVWSLAQPGCQQTVAAGARVTGSANGRTQVNRDVGQSQMGAPVISRQGQLVGVVSEGNQVIRASRISSLISDARALVASGSLLTTAEVARRENHSYGAVALRSDVLAASARITPMEPWHWEDLETDQRLPYTLNGPIGRYRVQLVAGGEVLNTVTVEPQAGATTQTLLTRPVTAEAAGPAQPGTPQLQTQGGGGFPVALVVLGVAAAGGGAAFLLMGGGDENGGGDPDPVPSTGSITIRIPIPGG
jgi:hypothetical protein